MDKTLIIFEFSDEIETFISHKSIKKLREENTFIIAILPEAQAFLKRMNIRFFNTYRFFTKEGHEKALLASDGIYQSCKSVIAIEDDIGIKEGYNVAFLLYIRLYVHYLLWLTEIIHRSCHHWGITKIVAFYRSNRHMPNPFLAEREGYAAEIGRKIADINSISFESFTAREIHDNLLFGKFKSNLIEAGKLAAFYVHNLINLIWNSNASILSTSRGYNLDRITNQFKKNFNGLKIIYMSEKKGRRIISFIRGELLLLPTLIIGKKRRDFNKKLGENVSQLNQLNEEVFTYKDIKLKNMVFNKIKKDIIPAIFSIYAQSVYLNSLLKKLKPNMIISQMSRYVNYNLGELASQYGIPSLLISHGSHVPPRNKYEMIEWKEHGLGLINTTYEYIAVQSPWARAYLDKIPSRSKQLITGPLLFAKIKTDKNKKELLRKKIVPGHEDKIILLHADTPRPRMTMRLNVYQTVDEFIHNINALIKAVEQTSEFYLILRLRPYLLNEGVLQSLVKSSCYSIHAEGSFEDYLSISDMLVSYSSTTIEEALQNRVPVLQYDSQGKYCHIEGQLLDPALKPMINSCYYVDAEERLQWALGWLVENHFSKAIPESFWNKHIFDKSEKLELTEYFKDLFQNNGIQNRS